MEWLTKLVDANQIGGWVRAGTASLFGAVSGWLVGPLVGLSDPATQTAVGIVLSSIVVGIWSSIAKKYTSTP